MRQHNLAAADDAASRADGRAPVFVLAVARRPQVLLTNLASALIGFALYSQSVVLSQLMQLPTITGDGLGQSMIAMALLLAPAGIVMMAISPLGARLTAARGPKTTLVVGAADLPSEGAFQVSMLIGLGVSIAAALLGMTIPTRELAPAAKTAALDPGETELDPARRLPLDDGSRAGTPRVPAGV